jgi:hypothetical protein
MDARFLEYIRDLDSKVDSLLASQGYLYTSLPRQGIPACGIYLFSEGARHLYVGRSNRIRGRLGSHCRPSSKHHAATFAFKLAREDTGITKAAFTSWGSRNVLSLDREFSKSFREAKHYVRKLEIRFVEETDQAKQALLEIYAAIRLNTPYNVFETH